MCSHVWDCWTLFVALQVEIFPYVINGWVGQALLLQDPDELATVRSWINYIVSTGVEQEGWLGPPTPNDPGMTYWPRWPVCMALLSWFEFTNDTSVLNATIQWQYAASARLTAKNPMIGEDWSGRRLQDWLWVLQYLIDSPAVPSSDKAFLLSFANQIQSLYTSFIDLEKTWFVDPALGGYFPALPVTQNFNLSTRTLID